MKKYCVYRITNLVLRKHYYGIKSIPPGMDPCDVVGVTYFSSSSDKRFIKDQKENPQNYRYKIIFVFDTVEESIKRESELHLMFEVWKNDNFYNLSGRCGDKFYYTRGSFGKKRTPESKALISNILSKKYREGDLQHLKEYQYKKGEQIPPEIIERRNNSIREYYKNGGVAAFKGRKHTEESKAKSSAAMKLAFAEGRMDTSGDKNPMRRFYDRIVTDEYRKKMSIACSGERNGFYGKKQTEEVNKTVQEKISKYIFKTPSGLFTSYELKKRFPGHNEAIKRFCSRDKNSVVRTSSFSETMKLFYTEFEEIKGKTFEQIGFGRFLKED